MSKTTDDLNIITEPIIENIYNIDGYDKDGYDKNGYDEDGYDKNGYDEDGYDQEGYDKKGYNSFCYDRQGNDLLDPDNPDAQVEVTGNCIISWFIIT